MNTSQKLDIHGLTIRGDSHDKNHDHFAIATLNKSLRLHKSNLSIDDDSSVHGNNQGHLFLVADGISSCPAPARASGTAIDSVVKYFLNEMPWYHLADGDPEDVTLALEDALRNAQDDVLQCGPRAQEGMGTTITLAFVCWPHLYVAHVGDSRCYLRRGRSLRQLTTDHTLATVCREAGQLATPQSEHVLWNAVGGRDLNLVPEVRHVLLEAGDSVVLVTDGVTKERSVRSLQALVADSVSAEAVCSSLVSGAGKDDRTAIVARFLPLEATHSEVEGWPDAPPLSAKRSLPTPSVACGPHSSGWNGY